MGAEIPDFVKIESKIAGVHPRIILFDHNDLPGKEQVFSHNYIIITFEWGIRFVLDLTGYQFGFQRILYTLAEYESQVLREAEDGEVVDMGEAIRRNEILATDLEAGIPGRIRARASELLEFALRSETW